MMKERWSTKSGSECADAVMAEVGILENEQSYRRTRALVSLSRYEGRRLSALNPVSYCYAGVLGGNGYERTYWNVHRSQVDSVAAKIAGRQRPKPQFMVTNGDWRAKRRAKKLDRFVEGMLGRSTTPYEDAWELGCQLQLDAEIFGDGVAKVTADHDAKDVRIERVMAFDLFCDLEASRDGYVREMFHVIKAERRDLLDACPAEETAIKQATRVERDSLVGFAQSSADMVRVVEVWRLPRFGKPGKHVICVDGATLVDEPWTREEFPFLFLRWTRQRIGPWSTGLIEENEVIVDEINYSVERMRESSRLTPKAICVAERDSITNESALESNEDCITILYEPGHPPPAYTNPAPFGPESLKWVEMNFEKAFQLTGVNQMSAFAQKQPGVTSGVALRTVADMETERFSLAWRDYESLFVGLARHIVWCAKELSEHDITARWQGDGFVGEIKWSEVDPGDNFVVTVAPVSGAKGTPADRLEMASTLKAEGVISSETYLELIATMDTPGAMEELGKQREVISRYVESWLDATPEEVEEGKFRYRSPNPHMQLPDAIIQVVGEYLAADFEDTDTFNLEFFLRFISDCDTQIQRRKRAEMEAQQPPQPPQASAPMAA